MLYPLHVSLFKRSMGTQYCCFLRDTYGWRRTVTFTHEIYISTGPTQVLQGLGPFSSINSNISKCVLHKQNIQSPTLEKFTGPVRFLQDLMFINTCMRKHGKFANESLTFSYEKGHDICFSFDKSLPDNLSERLSIYTKTGIIFAGLWLGLVTFCNVC